MTDTNTLTDTEATARYEAAHDYWSKRSLVPTGTQPPANPLQFGTTVAGLMTDAEKLTLALNKVLMEFPAIFQEPNLTWFCFLMDQVTDEVKGRIHPMEVAEQLFMRLVTAGDREHIAHAFRMGTLVANTLRERTGTYNEQIAAEMKASAGQIAGWKQPSGQ